MTEQEAYEMYERWMWLASAWGRRGRYKLASIHADEAADLANEYGWSDLALFGYKVSTYAQLAILDNAGPFEIRGPDEQTARGH